MSEYPERLATLLEYLELTGDRDERVQMLIDIASRFKGFRSTLPSAPFRSRT